MKRLRLLACLLLTNCVGRIDVMPELHPCEKHTAREFTFGTFECEPLVSDACAFDAHNQPTVLDALEETGKPIAYVCSCNDAGHYACFGAPGLAKAEPLP